MYAILFIVYVFVEGSAWWVCKRFYRQKINLMKYIRGFLFFNIPFAIIIVVDNAIRFIRGFMETSPYYTNSSNTIWNIVLFVLVYLFFVGYSFIGRKYFFRNTFVRAFLSKEYAVAVLMLAFVLAINYVTAIAPILAVPLGFLVIIPSLTFIRIYLFRLSNFD